MNLLIERFFRFGKPAIIAFCIATILLSGGVHQFASGERAGFEESPLSDVVFDDHDFSEKLTVTFDESLQVSVEEMLNGLGAVELRFFPYGIAEFTVPSFNGLKEALVHKLRESGLFKHVEETAVFKACYTPDDPLFDTQWNLEAVNVREAWDSLRGGYEGVAVGIVDSGVAYRDGDGFKKAEDFAQTRFRDGHDFFYGREFPYDDNGHGTYVTSIIAATTDNARQIAGISDKTTIIPIKALSGGGVGTAGMVASGIIHAVEKGAKVINLSISSPTESAAVKEAVDLAVSRGVIVVAAAGNDAQDFDYEGGVAFPASLEGVIAVGAINVDMKRAGYSNTGEGLDIVAPGGDILTDLDGDGLIDGVPGITYEIEDNPGSGIVVKRLDGTSAACAHVSAALALAACFNPDMDSESALEALKSSARKPDGKEWSEETGYGILDIGKLIGEAKRRPLYFAEGCTREGFDTWLCIANSTDGKQKAEVALFLSDGNVIEEDYLLDASSRKTISINSLAGIGKDVSIRVTAPFGVYAERPVYFHYMDEIGDLAAIQGGSNVRGCESRSNEFFFAEGCTREGFDTWLCLMNTSSSKANVAVRYMPGRGQGENIIREHVIQPNSRYTISVDRDAGAGRDLSIEVISDIPIVAERPMYFRYSDMITGGHDVVGLTTPSEEFFFAEGCTREGFDTWLCLANPNEQDALAVVRYMPQPGQAQVAERAHRVPANSRYTIKVNDDMGTGLDLSISVRSDIPIIAERPIYFLYKGEINGGFNVMGSEMNARKIVFAEGCTREGFDTWLCIANTGNEEIEATVRYMPQPGQGEVIEKKYLLAPSSRKTLFVNEEAGKNLDLSIEVEAEKQIAAERSMYFIYKNYTGGHGESGFPEPYLPEFAY